MSRDMASGGSPRVVGIVGDGHGQDPATLTRSIVSAMAVAGAQVLAGRLGADEEAVPADADDETSGVTWLALPASTGSAAGDHHALRTAIEEAGRDVERVVLDLGPTTGGAAMFFGPAVDDLLLLLGDEPEAVRGAAAYLGLLADTWGRDEVHVVVCGDDGPETASARVRELMAATAGAAPCLVPFGALPSRPIDVARAPVITLDARRRAVRAMAQALLQRPVPAVRGGLQFFLEGRAGLRRAS